MCGRPACWRWRLAIANLSCIDPARNPSRQTIIASTNLVARVGFALSKRHEPKHFPLRYPAWNCLLPPRILGSSRDDSNSSKTGGTPQNGWIIQFLSAFSCRLFGAEYSLDGEAAVSDFRARMEVHEPHHILQRPRRARVEDASDRQRQVGLSPRLPESISFIAAHVRLGRIFCIQELCLVSWHRADSATRFRPASSPGLWYSLYIIAVALLVYGLTRLRRQEWVYIRRRDGGTLVTLLANTIEDWSLDEFRKKFEIYARDPEDHATPTI